MFVLPLPRTSPESPDGENATEFHLLQWALHPPPSPSELVDALNTSSTPLPPSTHPISTVLFTSLIEYQRHQAYAPPYFVLTFYTHFAASHGIVLLRGEITPRSRAAEAVTAGADEKYMLSQTDAQLLAMGLQRFYLPRVGEDGTESTLLQTFNERPGDFKWEDLVAAWKSWGI